MFKFQNPCNILVSGPSQSGKTTWVKNLLDQSDNLFEKPLDRIVYCYGEKQAFFNEFRSGIEWVEGLPTDIEFDAGQNNCLILDDLLLSVISTPKMSLFFTQKSHHKNITVIFLVQNMFEKGKYMRLISLNSHILCIFKSHRSIDSIRSLGVQLGDYKFITDSFRDATSKPRGYLILDLHPATHDGYRVRTDIFNRERQIVYVKEK